MNERRCVLILFFDLPVQTGKQRKAYREFRKELLRSGYLCFQESVYVKLLKNRASVAAELLAVDRISPEDGTVDVLPVSLNRFTAMALIRGNRFDMSLFADDLIFL